MNFPVLNKLVAVIKPEAPSPLAKLAVKQPALPVLSPDILNVMTEGTRSDWLQRAFQQDPDFALTHCRLFGEKGSGILRNSEEVFQALPHALRSSDKTAVRDTLLHVAKTTDIDNFATMAEFNEIAASKGSRLAGWIPFEKAWQKKLANGENPSAVRKEILDRYHGSSAWGRAFTQYNMDEKVYWNRRIKNGDHTQFWTYIRDKDPVLKPFAAWMLEQDASLQKMLVDVTDMDHRGYDAVTLAADLGFYMENFRRTKAVSTKQVESWLQLMEREAASNNRHDDLFPLIDAVRMTNYDDRQIRELARRSTKVSDVGTFVKNAHTDPAPTTIAINPNRELEYSPFNIR
jgi:hypothetical protein